MLDFLIDAVEGGTQRVRNRRRTSCVLDKSGQYSSNSRAWQEAIQCRCGNEAGTHSPSVSRFLQGLDLRVVVANPDPGQSSRTSQSVIIAHNVAAMPVDSTDKSTGRPIRRLAVERIQTILVQQMSKVGPITSLYFVLKVGNPGRFQQTRDVGAFLGLCRSGTNGKLTRNYVFPIRNLNLNACWLAPRNTFWDLSGPTVGCASTDYVWPRREHSKPKSGPSSLSHEAAVLLLTLWKSRKPSSLPHYGLNRFEIGAVHPKPRTARRGRRSRDP